MLELRSHIKYVILFYLITAFILYKIKPTLMFNGNKIKEFGLGYGKTVFNYHIVLIFSSLIIFYIFELILVKKNNFL